MNKSAQAKEVCGTCRYLFGAWCHRFPPTPAANTDAYSNGKWPLVDWNDWCGEWAATSGGETR